MDPGHLVPRRALLAIGLAGVATLWSTAATAQDRLRISGYGNVHYMDHGGAPRFVGEADLNHGFIQLREFSLFFDFTITDRLVASTEIEAGDNGTRYTANYAYLDYQLTDALSFRAGKILVPFLSYNENKPNFRQHLMSQPFTAWNLAPVVGVAVSFHGFGWSDAGLMAEWAQPTGDVGLVSVKAAVINGLGSSSNVLDDNFATLAAGAVTPTVRPRDGLLQNEDDTSLRDNNADKALVAKVTWRSTSLPLDLGVSWYRGDWDPASTQTLTMVGAHANWLADRYSVKAEYVWADVDQVAGTDPVADAGFGGPAALNTSTGPYNMYAWYVEGSVVPATFSRNGYARLVGRYDEVDTNDQVTFTPFDRSRVTVGSELQIARDVRLRYEWQRTTIHDFASAPAPFVAAGGERVIEMGMASVIFAF